MPYNSPHGSTALHAQLRAGGRAALLHRARLMRSASRARWSAPTSPSSSSTCAASCSTAPRGASGSPATAPSTSARCQRHPRRARRGRRGAARHAAAVPEGCASTCRPRFGRALLIPALPRFTARYPELQLEVQFNDRMIDLIAEEVDLVVRVGAVREPHLHRAAHRDHAPAHLCRAGVPARARRAGASRTSSARHRLIGHLGTGEPPSASLAVPARRACAASCSCPSASPSTPSKRSCRPRCAARASCRRWICGGAKRSRPAGSRWCCREWSAPGAPISVVCRSARARLAQDSRVRGLRRGAAAAIPAARRRAARRLTERRLSAWSGPRAVRARAAAAASQSEAGSSWLAWRTKAATSPAGSGLLIEIALREVAARAGAAGSRPRHPRRPPRPPSAPCCGRARWSR